MEPTLDTLRPPDVADGGRNGNPQAPHAPHGLPAAWLRGIQTFYDTLHADGAPRACGGTACTFARVPGSRVGESAEGAAHPPGGASVEGHPVYCLGRCFEAPAHEAHAGGPIPRVSLAPTPLVLRQLLPVAAGGSTDPFEGYDLPDGLTILNAVEASGLRGRGGAAFPTARKWRVARETQAEDRYVVCNGDEGDPGSFVDRLLLEESPHAVISGMLACARAIGAKRGVLFIREEYPVAAQRATEAAAEATARGLLGDFHVQVMRGAGSYVAGEETALLRAVEGLRAEPWVKPPYPAERGLEGLPTVVQNVETLAVVPHIVRLGAKGNQKALSLSGAIRRPGVVEIELGMSMREVLESPEGGGGPLPGRRWKMALVGGPMGRVVAVEDFDVGVSYDALPGMGHGGIVVLDDRVSARALARHLYAFAAAESCGNCAPCRIGTTQLESRATRADLERLMDTLELGSLCGFGQGVPRPIRDLLARFPEEMFPC